MKARIHYKTGEVVETENVKKVNGRWLVSGDYPDFENCVYYVINKGKEYRLNGNRLIFQDYVQK